MNSRFKRHTIETDKAMREMEGVGQCVLTYDYNGGHAACGMTFFQCGMTPVVILTDLDRGVSITNSMEDAASRVYSAHFLHTEPAKILFFEHYPRSGNVEEFFRVKMLWNKTAERFCSPEFSPVSKNELLHLLSCYGYHRKDFPSLQFKPAKIISLFPRR